MLTGVKVVDQVSAKKAANALQEKGVTNVLVTVGPNGAYVFTKDSETHTPVPNIESGEVRDETGCGDQTMAALCSLIQDGRSLKEAARLAVKAGTLQFYRRGIQPITKGQLDA